MVGIQCFKIGALGIQADIVGAAGVTILVSALDNTIREVCVTAVSASVSPRRGDNGLSRGDHGLSRGNTRGGVIRTPSP